MHRYSAVERGTENPRVGEFDSHPVHIKAQTAIKLAMVIITILLKNVPCKLIKALTAVF